MKSAGDLSKVCSQIVLTCLYLARIGRPDILWSKNKFARSITKWTKACDKRLNQLISYIHHTCEYKQYCYGGNTAKQCRLGLFQDSVFVNAMTTRNHSKSRSPVKRDACRMSQTSTIAASSQSDSHVLAPSSARADSHGARFSVLSQPPGAPLQDVNTPTLVFPFAQPSGPTYRGDPPAPAPAPVSEPSPAVHLAHSDPFARARIAAVQSRVAAPVLSDPRPPPPVPVFSPFRDGHYRCSKCPRRGFTTIPGLMRHVHAPARGLLCGRGHLLLVRGDRTGHLHGSRLWWPQKNGRSGLQSMWTGQSGQAPSGV